MSLKGISVTGEVDLGSEKEDDLGRHQPALSADVIAFRKGETGKVLPNMSESTFL